MIETLHVYRAPVVFVALAETASYDKDADEDLSSAPPRVCSPAF